MDTAKQHWEILRQVPDNLANKVREFMVIGPNGDGVMLVTEDGLGFWFGTMRFEWSEPITATEPTPLNVPDLIQMAQGFFHILLLNKRGEIYSMGINNRGQLGLGTEDEKIRFTPQLIPSPHKFISVRCGNGHSLALTDDGKCWTWGDNEFGQAGVPSFVGSISSPRQISELDSLRIVAIECGGKHSLALTDQGVVYGWGKNSYGQLCDGIDTTDYEQWLRLSHLIPTRIPTPSPVQSMAAGDGHTLLLTQTGEVWACGDNEFGQLGLPATTESIASLSKVAGLPPISQIASHSDCCLSIAMSTDKRCFVWGHLNSGKSDTIKISMSTPLKLPPVYSTVESPLSFFTFHRYTPNSVQIIETPPSPLSTRMSRMFDNPETSSDVQFVVEQRTIHAHRIILNNSSDYFTRMFSEKWLGPKDPIVRVTIPDHSYQIFHSFLRFLYTDLLEVHLNFIPELFELATLYLVPDLHKACISRMRTNLNPATFCLYYPLTHRHSQLTNDFQQELVQFASTQLWTISRTSAYQSMEPNLRNNLYKAVVPWH